MTRRQRTVHFQVIDRESKSMAACSVRLERSGERTRAILNPTPSVFITQGPNDADHNAQIQRLQQRIDRLVPLLAMRFKRETT